MIVGIVSFVEKKKIKKRNSSKRKKSFYSKVDYFIRSFNAIWILIWRELRVAFLNKFFGQRAALNHACNLIRPKGARLAIFKGIAPHVVNVGRRWRRGGRERRHVGSVHTRQVKTIAIDRIAVVALLAWIAPAAIVKWLLRWHDGGRRRRKLAIKVLVAAVFARPHLFARLAAAALVVNIALIIFNVRAQRVVAPRAVAGQHARGRLARVARHTAHHALQRLVAKRVQPALALRLRRAKFRKGARKIATVLRILLMIHVKKEEEKIKFLANQNF